LTTLTNPIAVE